MVIKKKLDKAIYERKELLKHNYSRASAYYKDEFKKYYKSVDCKGEKINQYEYEGYDLDKVEYALYTFNSLEMGEKVALSQEDYAAKESIRFLFCKFEKCNINNMVFKNCCFEGCQFLDVGFGRVNFDNCIFSVPVIEKGADANEAYYSTTTFTGCIFVSEFNSCNLDNTLFERCNLTLSKFKKSSMQHSLLNACALSGVEVQDCKLQDFAIARTDIMDIIFADDRGSSVDENTLIDYRIRCKRKDAEKRNESGWIPGNYDDLCLKKSQTLGGFSKLFGLNGYSNLEGELFYFTKKIELKALHKLKKIKSVIALLICGYGERPSFTFYTMIISIVLFGIIYMFAGIQTGTTDMDKVMYPLENSVAVGKILSDFGKCIFFSLTTFSTVGYGNYVPLGTFGMIVSGIEMVLGISLCALWTGCIFRKITR